MIGINKTIFFFFFNERKIIRPYGGISYKYNLHGCLEHCKMKNQIESTQVITPQQKQEKQYTNNKGKLYCSPGAQGQLADVVLQPSRYQPSGKKILKSMSSVKRAN
jgi:hypothetical protein